MDSEVITIGNELIAGFTVDTNAAHMARQLTDIGFRVHHITSIGDSLEAMEEAFKTALRRSRVVLVCGGLGPTDDDITKKAIVKVFKRNLIFHEEVLSDIKERYARRGIDMPAINQNQALLPQGADFFPNRIGSAVGICISENGRVFIALPGVPREMVTILDEQVVPFLRGLQTDRTLHVETIHTTQIVESALAELLAGSYEVAPDTQLAYLPGLSGVSLRVVATAGTDTEAQEKARAEAHKLETIVGPYVYGYNDDTLPAVVGQLLKDNDKTVAVAESCTGGGLGALITSVPGSSAYFVGGIQAYFNEVKSSKLGVVKSILEEHGAVSEECAVAMATGARKSFESDYALSITGIAGPDGGTDDKPVGTTFIGLASAHTTAARKFNLGTDREMIRMRAAFAALDVLRRDILDLS